MSDINVREIEDLDILRPKKRMIKLSGKEIEVSFIPCGITFDVDEIIQKIASLGGEKDIQGSKEKTKEAFNLSIDLCVLFCKQKYPEMNREWFLNNTSPEQIGILVTILRDTLTKSYEGVLKYGKNE